MNSAFAQTMNNLISLTAGKRILSYSYVVVVVGLVESVETRALAHGPSDLGC